MIPFSSLSEKTDFILRAGGVYGSLVLFFFLNIVSLPLPIIGSAHLPLILMAFYYWAIYRPTLTPPALVFGLGLLLDLLTPSVMGVNALLFTLIYVTITNQRNFLIGQPFLVIWFGFCAVSAVYIFASWLIGALANFQWISPLILIPDLMLASLAFPLIAYILHLSRKILPDPKMPLTRQSKQRKFY
ncbi:MAG: rod shape-determining protein MreD [Alphaproteobacteria bacterium]